MRLILKISELAQYFRINGNEILNTTRYYWILLELKILVEINNTDQIYYRQTHASRNRNLTYDG